MAGFSGTTPFNVTEPLQRHPTNKKLFVTHHTASKTLTYRQSGSVHTNLGASGDITLTLPQNADKGVYFEFVVMVNFKLVINPGAAGALYVSNAKRAVGAGFGADLINESLMFVCVGDNDWVALYTNGQWTA